MTRNQGIALGVGVIVVALAGLIGLALWPEPPGPIDIRGKWRPANTASCAEGRYLLIGDDRISVTTPALTDDPLTFDTEIERTEKGPLLRLYIEGEPRSVNIRLQLDVHGNRMRFLSAEWAPEAKAEDGDPLDRFPIAQLLERLQKLQPLYPCP